MGQGFPQTHLSPSVPGPLVEPDGAITNKTSRVRGKGVHTITQQVGLLP